MSATSLRRRVSAAPSAKCTTLLPSARRPRYRKPEQLPSVCPIPITRNLPFIISSAAIGVMAMLERAGLNPMMPKGAYYIMCDIGHWGYPNDVEFSRFLVKDIGVATVPGSSFFSDPKAGKDIIRFTFCKKEETLRAAEERLSKLVRNTGAGHERPAQPGSGR